MKAERLLERFGRVRAREGEIAKALFGDRFGVLLFLGGLLFYGLYWRLGFLITDNWTIANTFVALTEGHLNVEHTIYGPPQTRTPGYHIVGESFYGRNYGQLVLGLPFYYLLKAISYIADLRIALAGAWSIVLIIFAKRLRLVLGSESNILWLGTLAALLTFAINTVYAQTLNPRWIYLLAMQLSNIVVASLLGVFIYRLIAGIHNRRIGLFIGAATILATPIAFWASIPKRHIFVSFFGLLTLYAFYRSRSADSDRTALAYRSLAYVSVGLWAWVHAPEALAMFVVLVAIDLATARRNDFKTLATVGGSFGVSLLPFLLTNWLISGNPVKPPRFLSRSDGTGGVVGGGGPQGPAQGVQPDPSGVFSELLSSLLVWIEQVTAPLRALGDLFMEGAVVVFLQPSRLYHTFIQSAPSITRATATDLTILESTPIFGILVAIPLIVLLRRRDELRRIDWSSPLHQTDVFAFAFVIAFTLLYMSRLPLHALWTVRYLLPVVPFGMYAVGRLGLIDSVISTESRLFLYSYAAVVLFGGQFMVVYLATTRYGLDSLMQFHGTIGLLAAIIGGIWAVLTVSNHIPGRRYWAVALAIPLGTGTLFVLMTGIEYYVNAGFVLQMTAMLSELIPIL